MVGNLDKPGRSADLVDGVAATDSGFSTAWSKDGRKFAVASQGERRMLRLLRSADGAGQTAKLRSGITGMPSPLT
jgi:hypothetical protein